MKIADSQGEGGLRGFWLRAFGSFGPGLGAFVGSRGSGGRGSGRFAA